MQHIFEKILNSLKPYFDGLLQDETGQLYLLDDELGGEASACTTGEVAGFYLATAHILGGNGDRIASKLLDRIAAKQLDNGAFSQPYYVRNGEEGTVDIAEVGAVAKHCFNSTGGSETKPQKPL